MDTFLGTCDTDDAGREMVDVMRDLFPICRSITGDGLRESLGLLQKIIPLELNEVPSGTQVFDWTVPKEWNIRDAYVKNDQGERVIDFQRSNLHLVNYSVPVFAKMTLAELKPYIHTMADYPEWVPYRTSYYNETWGFCLSHNALEQLPEGEYEVCVDSSLEDGSLTYGELVLPGSTADEVLISCHSCHPSLCNDNLSGMVLAAFLARHLSTQTRRYSYRFLFVPGTIGAITWLALNADKTRQIRHGLTVACVGDAGHSTYKRSRQGNAEIDRAVEQVLKQSGQSYEIVDFSPYGYDERQYCSSGFNLAVGSLTRTPHGRFPEYHTSADNLDFVQPDALSDSLTKYLTVFDVLENNRVYRNQKPYCEPQLGKRGLYGSVGGGKSTQDSVMAMLWVLNLSDGTNSLLDIAERSGMEFELIRLATEALAKTDLLAEDDA